MALPKPPPIFADFSILTREQLITTCGMLQLSVQMSWQTMKTLDTENELLKKRLLQLGDSPLPSQASEEKK
jgi:hypothetical protein